MLIKADCVISATGRVFRVCSTVNYLHKCYFETGIHFLVRSRANRVLESAIARIRHVVSKHTSFTNQKQLAHCPHQPLLWTNRQTTSDMLQHYRSARPTLLLKRMLRVLKLIFPFSLQISINQRNEYSHYNNPVTE